MNKLGPLLKIVALIDRSFTAQEHSFSSLYEFIFPTTWLISMICVGSRSIYRLKVPTLDLFIDEGGKLA